nr:calmodulin [Gastrodia elata]
MREMREMQEMRPAFDVLDANGDGRISREDLRAFFSSGYAPASDNVLAAMISAADADKNGFVEFEEFEGVLPGDDVGAGIMEEVFRMMDGDGDGKVGFHDLKRYLSSVGIPADDDDVLDMIRSAASDHSSASIGLHDLLRFLSLHPAVCISS